MTLLWVIAVAALAAALLAWRAARKTGERLEQLSDMHWALRYQYGELRAQLQRNQPALAEEDTREVTPPGDAGARSVDGFVPLSSLKR